MIGFTIVTKAAKEDMAPKVPTALGLNFVKPNAVNGMNKSHEFFKLSMNISLWQFTNACKCFKLDDKLKVLAELVSNSEGFKKVDLFKSNT